MRNFKQCALLGNTNLRLWFTEARNYLFFFLAKQHRSWHHHLEGHIVYHRWLVLKGQILAPLSAGVLSQSWLGDQCKDYVLEGNILIGHYNFKFLMILGIEYNSKKQVGNQEKQQGEISIWKHIMIFLWFARQFIETQHVCQTYNVSLYIIALTRYI